MLCVSLTDDFFGLTLGRILNRFSKDVGFLDDLLPYHFCEFILVSTFQQYSGRPLVSLIVLSSCLEYQPFCSLL